MVGIGTRQRLSLAILHSVVNWIARVECSPVDAHIRSWISTNMTSEHVRVSGHHIPSQLSLPPRSKWTSRKIPQTLEGRCCVHRPTGTSLAVYVYCLARACKAIRTSPKEDIGCSSAELVCGMPFSLVPFVNCGWYHDCGAIDRHGAHETVTTMSGSSTLSEIQSLPLNTFSKQNLFL